MAHYAFINSQNIVIKVIAGVDETVTQIDNGTEIGGSTEAWEQFYQNQEWHKGLICKRCSYNANMRGKYPALGDVYNAELDAFEPAPIPDLTPLEP